MLLGEWVYFSLPVLTAKLAESWRILLFPPLTLSHKHCPTTVRDPRQNVRAPTSPGCGERYSEAKNKCPPSPAGCRGAPCLGRPGFPPPTCCGASKPPAVAPDARVTSPAAEPRRQTGGEPKSAAGGRSTVPRCRLSPGSQTGAGEGRQRQRGSVKPAGPRGNERSQSAVHGHPAVRRGLRGNPRLRALRPSRIPPCRSQTHSLGVLCPRSGSPREERSRPPAACQSRGPASTHQRPLTDHQEGWFLPDSVLLKLSWRRLYQAILEVLSVCVLGRGRRARGKGEVGGARGRRPKKI